SHDLRTPLSHVQLEMSMLKGRMDDQIRRDVVRDLDDMNSILESFVDFARAEDGEASSPTDLSELARACCEGFSRRGVHVKFELGQVAGLDIRPVAFQRLLRNLLLNAERHGGGDIVVRASVGEAGVCLSVLDRGPGIAPDRVEEMKQPFTREDDARSGP